MAYKLLKRLVKLETLELFQLEWLELFHIIETKMFSVKDINHHSLVSVQVEVFPQWGLRFFN